MKKAEKNRLQLVPGDGSSLALSGRVSWSSQTTTVCEDYSTILEELQDHLDTKFSPKKVRSSVLADTYFDLGLNNRALLVSNCGSFLEFRLSKDTKNLSASNFCRDRLCPMCNWRRSLKIFSQVSQIMDILESRGYKFLFLTLTLRNSDAEKFPDMIQNLFDGWRFFYNKHTIVKKTLLGTFRSIETTINQKNHTFHAHIHCPIAVKSDYFHKGYITTKQWSQFWKESCKLDYDPIVHIERFKPKPGSTGIGSAVAEAVKYAVKDYDYLAASDVWRPRYVSALLDGLSGRRLVSMTGCFNKVHKELKLDNPEDGDLVDVDGIQLRDDVACMIVQYHWKNGVYVQEVL